MDITKEIVTYQQIKDGYQLQLDNYQIGSYTMRPSIVKTFLSNPSLSDHDDCMLFFSRVDGVIGGRQMFFPTKVKVGEEEIIAQSGSSLETVEKFREYAIGMDMINYPIKSKKYPLILYSGIAKMAIPIYKALRFYMLYCPEYWQIRRCNFFFQNYGISFFITKPLSGIGNLTLRMIRKILSGKSKKMLRKFEVNKLTEVPSWAEDIINTDNHKYSEVHDRKWMQWTLDNNFFGKKLDTQSFFAIYFNGKPVGFFMTKERDLALPDRNIQSVVFGTVYEWGSIDETLLSEYDIYKIANLFFSDNVSIFNVASPDFLIKNKLKRLGMFRHGETLTILKDIYKAYPDAKDISNWRIRYGYADVPFY